MRRDVLVHARKMWEAGLVVGSAGNVSCRSGEGRIAITPSGIPYDEMVEDVVVLVDITTGEKVDSARVPSYELPLQLGEPVTLPADAIVAGQRIRSTHEGVRLSICTGLP